MRRFLVFAMLLVVASWLLMWGGSWVMNRAYSRGSAHAWPVALGMIDDVPARYPPTTLSSGALSLTQLAAKLQIELAPRHLRSALAPRTDPLSTTRKSITDYVAVQLQRTDMVITDPPSDVAEFLAAHAGDLTAVRNLLLSGERIEWPSNIQAGSESPIPNLLGHMYLTRVLHASALDRARANDHGAWDDLRASWMLTGALWRRPELITTLIALAISRSINALARKLPLPAPPWFTELQRFDYLRATLSAYQADAWSIKERAYIETSLDETGETTRLTRRAADAILLPYTRMCTADWIDAERRVAHAVVANRACDFRAGALQRDVAWWNLPARRSVMANLDSIWQRLFRFRAEIEATDRALAMRAGGPQREQSWCSDGKWIYSTNGVRFSRELPRPRAPMSAMPLEFQNARTP